MHMQHLPDQKNWPQTFLSDANFFKMLKRFIFNFEKKQNLSNFK